MNTYISQHNAPVAFRHFLSLCLLFCTFVLLSACESSDMGGGASGKEVGTLVVAIPAEPTTLFPPVSDAGQDAPIIHSIFDHLAELSPELEITGDGGFEPRLARSWKWAADSLSIAFLLDSTAQWHDGKRINAEDVRYTFSVYSSDSVVVPDKSLLSNIDSVTVADSLTAVFWFKRRTPQQFYSAAGTMYILPSHLLSSIPMKELASSSFARNPVGTGLFRFGSWEAGQRVEIVADTDNPRGSPGLARVIWSIAPDFGAATVRLFAGEADFFEYVRPGDLAQIARTPSLRLVDERSLQYIFLGFNFRNPADLAQPHPVFSDSRVRRALSMAVDRAAIVANAYDTLGIVGLGPAPRALIPDTTAFKQIPYNPAAARALLDSAGWKDSNDDGVRENNGQRLTFEMLVPSSSAGRRSLAVLLQDQLRSVGAEAIPRQLEVNAFSTRTDNGKFDTYLGGWASSPGLMGMTQTWGSKGSGNAGRYKSVAFDALVDSATSAFSVSANHRLWGQAFQQIVDDAPAIWLVEQRTPVVLHKRFVIPPLRADGWYMDLDKWRVDPTQLIPRDRVSGSRDGKRQLKGSRGSSEAR